MFLPSEWAIDQVFTSSTTWDMANQNSTCQKTVVYWPVFIPLDEQSSEWLLMCDVIAIRNQRDAVLNIDINDIFAY